MDRWMEGRRREPQTDRRTSRYCVLLERPYREIQASSHSADGCVNVDVPNSAESLRYLLSTFDAVFESDPFVPLTLTLPTSLLSQ